MPKLFLKAILPSSATVTALQKHPIKQGRVGIDIGTQTIAFSGKDVCDLRVLAPSARAQAKKVS